MTIPVPAGSRSRDLVVEIKKKNLKVGVKGKPLIIEGELCKEVKLDDSTWTLGAFLLSWFTCHEHQTAADSSDRGPSSRQMIQERFLCI